MRRAAGGMVARAEESRGGPPCGSAGNTTAPVCSMNESRLDYARLDLADTERPDAGDLRRLSQLPVAVGPTAAPPLSMWMVVNQYKASLPDARDGGMPKLA